MGGGPDQILTMEDYYDGPRGGVATLGGRPVVYRSLWADVGDGAGEDTFLLQPIDAETLALALEDWEIWRRWDSAFHAGLTTVATHPALPVDRARHEELATLLAPRTVVSAAAARARLRILGGPAERWGPFPVAWDLLGPTNE